MPTAGYLVSHRKGLSNPPSTVQFHLILIKPKIPHFSHKLKQETQ